MPLACPVCGAVDIALVGGDELVLESIEYRG
jgi:Zn finger protein HypA/HybF involved in hydrogenase expression